ncbi:MAG: hypothetical protein ACTSQB_07645 [Candidatus Heimdallarchaeota archaeon]
MIKEISKWTLALTLIIIFILAFASLALAIKTFTIQENDQINVNLNTSDLDGDNIVHYFDAPLDENGVWETNYDDAGEYVVEVSASDGIDKTTEKIKIIVENVNREPLFIKEGVTYEENDLIDLKRFIVDPDEDVLNYEFEEPFDEEGLWQTDYYDAGIYIIEIVVADDEFEVKDTFEIIIEDKNQEPVIEEAFSESKIVYGAENETLYFDIEAEDYDDDELSYNWYLDNELIADLESGEWYFNFDSSGEHNLTVTISDGELETSLDWEIKISNTNRVPDISNQRISVYETELVDFDLPETDQDGDELIYTFDFPLDENGEWQTSYEDAGTYTIDTIADDGEFTSSLLLIVKVIDLDRAPELNLPEVIEVWEGDELEWFVDAEDLDGDDLSFEFTGLPDNVDFDNDGQEVEWDVPYDHIYRNSNFFTNILNALHLEHYFITKVKETVSVKVCGKELCSSGELDLIVYNTNQAPKLSRKGGKWKTGYEDEGEYTVYVTASDGFLTDTEAVKIYVNKNNRAPTIIIKDDDVVVNEGQEFMIKIDVDDPDSEDVLTITLNNPPEGSQLVEDAFIWTPSYDSVQNRSDGWWSNLWVGDGYFNKKFNKEFTTFWLDFTVSDGITEVVHPVKVVVKNVNQPPEIVSTYPEESTLETEVGDDPLEFNIDVDDFDEDELEYRWTFSDFDFNNVEGDVSSITREFTAPGEKKVKVVVDDGRDSVEHEWTVYVTGEPVTDSTAPEPTPNTSDDYTVKVYVFENWSDD